MPSEGFCVAAPPRKPSLRLFQLISLESISRCPPLEASSRAFPCLEDLPSYTRLSGQLKSSPSLSHSTNYCSPARRVRAGGLSYTCETPLGDRSFQQPVTQAPKPMHRLCLGAHGSSTGPCHFCTAHQGRHMPLALSASPLHLVLAH